MASLRNVSITCAVLLCHLSTPARGDDSQVSGITARVGSSVGFSDIRGYRWSHLGTQMATGIRLGPIALEGEYERGRLTFFDGKKNRLRGAMRRGGITARAYLHAFHMNKKKTDISLFAESSAGIQFGLLKGHSFSRSDIGAGLGWHVDHRWEQGIGGVERIGWHVGWRIVRTSSAPTATARIVCFKSCPTPSRGDDLTLSMGSAMTLSW